MSYITAVINEAKTRKLINYDKAVILFDAFVKKFGNDKYFLLYHNARYDKTFVARDIDGDEEVLDVIVNANNLDAKYVMSLLRNGTVSVVTGRYKHKDDGRWAYYITIDKFDSFLKIAKNYEQFLILAERFDTE